MCQGPNGQSFDGNDGFKEEAVLFAKMFLENAGAKKVTVEF